MIYALIGCLIIIGFLGFKLFQKQKIDTTQRNKLADEVQELHNQVYQAHNDLANVQEKTEYEKYKLEECKKDLQAALDVYQNMVDNKLKDIDTQMEEQRQKRQKELDANFEEKKRNIELALESTIKECDDQAEQAKNIMAEIIQQCTDKSNEYYWKVADAQERFDAIERVLASYEKERQAKLFYTIQLPEEFQEDIEFLLITVAAKVQHPDIISKLVWQEYVKPNLEDTFKRIEIKSEPGIYKLTSLIN